MKTKKFLALILALCTLLSLFIMPVGATEEHNHGDIEVFILNEDISEEAKEKMIAYYLNDEHEHKEDDETATYGLICSVIGHKIEESTTYVITHKVRSTDPRCLKKTYLHEVCSRCDDYSKTTTLSSIYISCCA